MDKLEKYRDSIKQILTEHAQLSSPSETVEAELIFDEKRDRYQLAYVGWQGNKRVFGPIVHFDIQDGKIWIQYNGTEEALGERLMSMGVPPSDIVLGFRSAFKRQFGQYAVS